MSFQAAIFPGQGAQLVGMGRDLAAAFPAAAAVFAEADRVLGFGLSQLCFEGPAERLEETDIQQPAIFVTSVAAYRAAIAAGVIRADSFGALGGLSLGEYTALHLAGALPFADALRLVYRRGQLMQQASGQTAGGMVSLIGMDEPQALALCEKLAARGRIRPANYNCPGQIVISGDKAAADAAVELAGELGGRAIALKVAGAFHSELMKPAADALRPALAAAGFARPHTRVIGNVDAEYHKDPEQIRESLYRQVFNPVRWQACVERLIEDGATGFWEIGPNRVLAGLLRKINRKMPCQNIGTAEELRSAGAPGGAT